MPKSVYKKRGGVIRYRTRKLSRRKYLKCAIVRKNGKKGGRTVCTVHKYKKSK